MTKFAIEADNIKTIEMALDMAVASTKRAMTTSKRPEFNAVYEKELADLYKAKTSLKVADKQDK